MTWWERLKAIARRETQAVRNELGRAAEVLDEALAKKERELEATPAERVDMLLEEIDQEDARFEEIEDRLRTSAEERAAAAGLEPRDPAPEPPDHRNLRDTITVETIEDSPQRMTHRVMLDGHVLQILGETGIDAVVADLPGEVMVLDADREDDLILLRTPTLDEAEVADLVAANLARRL
jgi:hypothetical protein